MKMRAAHPMEKAKRPVIMRVMSMNVVDKLMETTVFLEVVFLGE
jgi:hypothetical protein